MPDDILQNLLPEDIDTFDTLSNEIPEVELSTNNIQPSSKELADQIIEQTRIQEQTLELSKGERDLLFGDQRTGLGDVFKLDSELDVGGVDVNPNEILTTLKSGEKIAKFDSFTSGIDNENNLALQQSAWEQTLNGVGKGIAKTAFNILDGTVGTVVGLANGITEGNFSAVFNNGFSKWIDDVNIKMDSALPNYYTQEQKNMNFLESLGTTNFWANDFLGGMSFMLGTIGSEGIWALATGGASLTTAIPRIALKATARGLLKTGAKQTGKNFYKNSLKLLKSYNSTIPKSNIAKALNNTRFLYTSAGYEAGVEARHSLNESMESFVSTYQSEYGRNPSGGEYAEFMQDAVVNANKVFASNVALVGASNIAQFGSYFGLGTGLNKAITKSIGRTFGLGVTKTIDDTGKIIYNRIKSNKLQRGIGNTLDLLKSPIVEGFVEEGGQSVISKTSQKWLASRYNPDALRSNFSVIQAATDSFEETYGTREGLKEVGLGMLIGFFGDRGTRATSGGSIFGTDFNDNINKLDKDLDILNKSTTRMNQVQKDLLNRLVMTNQFNTFLEKSKDESEKGNIAQASIDWDTAQYSKMLIEKSAGLMDESLTDFKRVIENTPNEALREEYGLSESQVKDYKTALVNNYSDNLSLFKEASRIAETLNPNSLELGGSTDYTQELGLNIYLGVKSAQRANDTADSIDELIGTTGIASALKLYTNLTKKGQRRAERIVKLQQEITSLEEEFLTLQEEFTASSIVKEERVEENTKVSSKLNTNQLKREKLQKTLNSKQTELKEIEGKLENRFYKGKFAFGGSFNIFKDLNSDEALISDEAITNSVKELRKLDSYKKILGEQNPEALGNLNLLIDEYLKNIQAFRDFNLVYEQMADPRFAKSQYKGVARLFEGVGTNFNEETIDPFFEEDNVRKEIFFANNADLSEDERFTVETLLRMSKAFRLNINVPNITEKVESISTEIWQQYNDNGSVPDQVIQDIATKIKDNPSNPNLSERENAIFTNETDLINDKLRELRLEEGDSITELVDPELNTKDETTLVGQLRTIVNKVINSKDYLKGFNVSEFNQDEKPTEKDYQEFDKLFKQKIKGTLTPKKNTRLNELRQKINDWGRLEGTLIDSGISLSDILEQISLLETQQETSNNTLPSIVNLNELVDVVEFVSSVKSGNYDNLQSYDKAFVSKDNFGDFAISNINLNGILDIINEDLNFTLERKGQVISKKNDIWNITNIEEGQIYNLKYQVEGKVEKITFKIGKGKNIIISPRNKNKLNEVTSLKIFPSNNLSTNFQPLLREVNINGEVKVLPVDTNFTFAEEIQLNNSAVYSLRPDDLVYLEVNTNDPFNKKLLKEYNEASDTEKPNLLKKLENSLIIYLKDKNNNFLGVHKAVSNVETTNDENLITLHKIRKVTVKRVLDENFLENQVIDLNLSLPVAKVYQGHPNFNMVKEDGTVFVKNIEFNSNSLNQVSDVGYIQNGKLVLKNKSKNVSKHPFATNILRSQKYKGKKVPVIVFNFEGENLVYPITLKPIDSDVSSEVDNIVTTNTSVQNKIIELNKLLITQDLDINKNGFTFDNFNQQHIEQVKELLKESKAYSDVSKWLDPSRDITTILTQEATINIDITDKPFHSPKIKTKIKEINGLDSEYLLDVGIQEVLPTDVESEVSDIQGDNC